MNQTLRGLRALLCALVLTAGLLLGARSSWAAQYTAIGDSLTYGLNASPGQAATGSPHPSGFAPTLRRLLEINSSPTASYAFANRGVSGATSGDVVAGQLTPALSPAPDIVTVTVGTNDVRAAIQNGTALAAFQSQFASSISQIFSALRSGAPARQIIAANVPKLQDLPAFSSFTTAQREAINSYVVAANAIIADRAAQYGATVVDLYGDANSSNAANISVAPEAGGDGIHPNRRGHDLLAQRFLRAAREAATTIDFQMLEHLDSASTSATSAGASYQEDGFSIQASALSSFGTQAASYPGSTALFGGAGGLIQLQKTDGAAFGLASIDLAELNGPSAATVTFTGTRADGSTVAQSFTTDGAFTTNSQADNDAQTFAFSGFTNLVKVTWTQAAPYHQFDNIRVAPVLSAPFAPDQPDLSVALAAAGNTRRGSSFSYTATLTNGGPAAIQGAGLSLPLPANTSFASVSAPAGWATSAPAVGSGGTVSASISSFAPGSAVFTITVTVAGAATVGSSLDATATADALSPDVDYADRSAGASTQVLEDQSLVVTTTSDASTGTDGLASLREAIAFANSDGVPSNITFAVSGTIRLASALPGLAANGAVSITNAQAAGVTVSGDANGNGINDSGDVPIFAVASGAVASVSNLTISGGRANGGGATGGGAISNNSGTLTVTSCALIGNSANVGGAIFSNTSDAADGQPDPARLTLLRGCTISGNAASFYGGGVYNSNGLTRIEGCTIVGNSAPLSQGAGVASYGDNLTRTRVQGTIIADGRTDGAGADSGTDVDFVNTINPFVSQGANLIGDGAGAPAFTQSGDRNAITAAQVLVDSLAQNGGPTPTRALLPGSVAIDSGASALATDGRGLPRSRRGQPDIGAFEVQNERPIVSGFTKSVNEDATLTFAASDFSAAFSGPEVSDSLAGIRVAALPDSAAGALQLNGAAVAQGQVIAASALGLLRFVPAANFNGAASFSYIGSDGFGFGVGQGTAAVTMQVLAVNDAPAISQVAGQSTDEDTATPAIAFTIGDVESEPGALSVSAASSNAALVPVASIALGGSGANHTVSITPAPDQSGSATITLTVSDGTGQGSASSSTSFTLQVLAVNDAPAAQDQSVGTQEDARLDITLGVSDVDSAALTFEIVGSPRNGTLSPADGNGAGRIYTPRPDFNGFDSFTFRASDGALSSNIATVTIMVSGENDAPVAAPDAASTDEDTPLAVQVLGNDSDADGDALRVALVAATSATHGTVAISADRRSVLFAPEADYNGPASFTYAASDGALESTATVAINVRPVNDAPVAASQSLAATTTAPLPITLGATDIDSQNLAFSVLAQPQNGTLSGSGSGLRYTARRGFQGTDSFTFHASDGSLSSTATITIRVTDTNAAPIAIDDLASTVQSTPLVVQVLANDTDADGDTLAVSALDSGGARGTVSISADGMSVLFVPEDGFIGSTGFGYTVSDGAKSASARVAIEVLPVLPTGGTGGGTGGGGTDGGANSAPVAAPDSYAVRGRLQVLAARGVLANDRDADGSTLSARLSSTPRHGTLSFGRDGSFVYVPAVGYAGRDSFTYAASDGQAESAITSVTLTVTAERDVTPPVVTLAGGSVRLVRRLALAPVQGNAADVYLLKSGPVVSSGIKGVTVQLQRSNGDFWNGRAYQKAPSSLPARRVGATLFTAPASAMPPLSLAPSGRYKWTAIATDNAGNASRATQFVLVDAVAPMVAIATPPASADGVARIVRLDLVSGRVSEAARIEMVLRRGDGKYWNGRSYQAAAASQKVQATGGTWRFAASALPSGRNLLPGRLSIEVRATDQAGNVGRAVRTVVVASSPAG